MFYPFPIDKSFNDKIISELKEIIIKSDKKDKVEAGFAELNKKLGKFKDKKWEYLFLRKIKFEKRQDDNEKFCLIEGTITQYSDNCSLSPDGIAMVQFNFCVVYFNDIWDERYFVSYA